MPCNVIAFVGEIIKEFEDRYPKEKLEKILEFSQIKGSIKEIESIFDVSQLESWNEIKLLFDSLENRGVSNVRINFGIVRGLDYYSGIVFEVFDKNSKLGALAGGGRYDTLTKAFKRDDIGATGVAGGVERIILTMQEQNIISEIKQPRVSVLYINDDMQKVAHSITSLLRLNNIPTDIKNENEILDGYKTPPSKYMAPSSKYIPFPSMNELSSGSSGLSYELSHGSIYGTPPGLTKMSPYRSPYRSPDRSPDRSQYRSPDSPSRNNDENRCKLNNFIDFYFKSINRLPLQLNIFKRILDTPIKDENSSIPYVDMLINWLNQLLNDNGYNKKISNYIQNDFTKADNISYVPEYLCRTIYIFRKIDDDHDHCILEQITIDNGMNYYTLIKLLFNKGCVKEITPTFKKKDKESKYDSFIPPPPGMSTLSINDVRVQFT